MIPAQNTLLMVLFLGVCTSALVSCSGRSLKTLAGQDHLSGDSMGQPEIQQQDIEGVDSLEQTISDLEDKILALEKKIAAIQEQLSGAHSLIHRSDPIDPESLYQNARRFLKEKKFAQAAEMFHTFVREHPLHSLADNAMYWQGECYYASRQYKMAIQVFKDLIQTYPRAGKVPDALLKTGYAFLSLDDADQADVFFKRLLTQYPFSSAAEKAQKKLKKFD